MIKILLVRLPIGYMVWQKIGLFRHGSMDEAAYAFRVFNEHMDKISNNKLKGKTILEIGPGDSVSTAIIAVAYGASSILVDAGHYAQSDITPYLPLCALLREKGLDVPEITINDSFEGMLRKCNSIYLTEGVSSFDLINDSSVDIIFSQAVLEHVPYDEFTFLMDECIRVCKATSVSSHQVDLRDHLGGGLNNLRFSHEIWESKFFSSSGFYTNRIRFEEMIFLFEQAGFDVKVMTVVRWDKLPIKRNKLSHKFKGLSDKNLRVKVFDVVIRINK